MARDPDGDPDAAAWGAPGCVNLVPEQPPKLVLRTSEICTTHLLLRSRIPQVQDEPRAAPWAAGGAAGTPLCWAAGRYGAGGAVSSPTRAPAVPQQKLKVSVLSWLEAGAGSAQAGELPDHSAGAAEQ